MPEVPAKPARSTATVEHPSFYRRAEEARPNLARVEDLMSEALLVCQQSEACAIVVDRMREGNVGFLPVLNGEKVVGVVTDRDIALRHVGSQGATLPHGTVAGCMTSRVVSIAPAAKIEEAVRLMRENQIGRILVMENEELKGILTLGDVFTQTAHSHHLDRVVKKALSARASSKGTKGPQGT